MARTNNDAWDLTSSVGATATMVAAARAMATHGLNPLINDPFAEPLVRAAGIRFFADLASGELDPAGTAHAPLLGVQRMTDVMAVRTRYFDHFFTDAAQAGIRQAVILASGLDSRAYRLHWPLGTTVFEVDQPAVVEFKSATLADLGAAPTADRRVVPIDLRHDWPVALRHAGFHTDRPTAWIAEGLLAYLPPDAQDRLLDDITALSAKGSRLAGDGVPDLPENEQDYFRKRIHALNQNWHNHGFDTKIDMTRLVYWDPRNDLATYLNARGWETIRTSVSTLLDANGLNPVAEDDEDRAPFAKAVYVSATLR